jgi:hypothetical protein
MQKVQINTLSELNLQPLQELLNKEVDLEALIKYLDCAYHYFTQNSMKVSYSEGEPVDEEEIVCQYWIERLKVLFEEMKN